MRQRLYTGTALVRERRRSDRALIGQITAVVVDLAAVGLGLLSMAVLWGITP